MSTRTTTEAPAAEYSTRLGPNASDKGSAAETASAEEKASRREEDDGIEASVKQLAHTIRNVRTNFSAEAQTLRGFDILRFKGRDDKVLVLRPEWDTLRKEFENCVRDSLRQATRASNRMLTMSNIFSSLDNTDLEDKHTQAMLLEEIRKFVDALNEDERLSEKIRDRFDRLVDDVKDFKEKITYTVDEAETAVQSQIESLKKRLPELESELKGHTSGCGGKASTKSASGKTADALEAEIAKIKEEKVIAERLASQIPDIRKHLEEGMPAIDKIAKGIAVMGEIWRNISSYTYSLESSLEMNFGDGWPTYARNKLNAAKERYYRLSEILEDYIYQAQKAAE